MDVYEIEEVVNVSKVNAQNLQEALKAAESTSQRVEQAKEQLANCEDIFQTPGIGEQSDFILIL